MSTRIGPGRRIPSFELRDQHGALVRSDDWLGQGPIVIFFYPQDETPGCTAEACSFRDANEDFAAAGARVVGISSDGVESHRRFAETHALGYTLLADEGGRVRAEFGVHKQLLGLVDGRVTFIVDASGVIRQRFDSALRARKHVEEALRTVRDLAKARTRA